MSASIIAFPIAVAAPLHASRPTSVTRTFAQAGRFAAMLAAEKLLSARGFCAGPMQGVMPRGLRFGRAIVNKWTTMTPGERTLLHGKMSGDLINGPVTVEIFGTAPADALAAFAREC